MAPSSKYSHELLERAGSAVEDFYGESDGNSDEQVWFS